MKKYIPWLAALLVLFSGVACRFTSINNTAAAPTPFYKTPVPLITQAPLPPAGDLQQTETLLVDLYRRVDPGVVAIQVLSEEGGGLGSGFVFDQEGHIVTNYHVVEGATDLEVDFPSGMKVRGKVVGSDLDSDLAVVKVDVPAGQLTPLTMGDSDQLSVGQMVVAIGNPFGLNGTMTTGIVSAKGRTLDSLRQSPSGGTFTAGDIIQTDAAINPGNSGGPLLNLNGEVVGVNRAIRTNGTMPGAEPQNSGVGFAVSANIVKRVVPVLIEKGAYDYPYLGMTSRSNITLIEQEELGLPQTWGAYVLAVVPGGPADKAGLRGGTRDTKISGLKAGGDLLIAVDGRPVMVFDDMLGYLMTSKSPGDTIVLTIIRDNEQKEVTVTLGKRP